jgi:hypothetical protein
MLMRKWILIGSLLASPAFAVPVTYEWTGTLIDVSPSATVYDGTTEMWGSFTYDPDAGVVHPTYGYYRGQVIRWDLHVGGQTFFDEDPDFDLARLYYGEDDFVIWDELPYASWHAGGTSPVSDLVKFKFNFADSVIPGDVARILQVDSFTGGTVGFWGTGAFEDQQEFLGSIDTLTKVGPVLTSAEAVSRAKSAWKSIYEKNRQRAVYSEESTAKFEPYMATLKDGVWHVRGTVPRGYRGEILETTVRERDGSVSVTVVQIR